MSSDIDSVDGVAKHNWRTQLEAVASHEPALWMPPGRLRLDWTELAALNGQAKLAGLFGPRRACEFPVANGTDANPAAEAAMARLLSLGSVGSPSAQTQGPVEFFLGFPYLWVPPRIEGEIEHPPILIPLVRLPVELDLNPALGHVTIRVRNNPDGTPGGIEPNPVFVLWLEHVTGKSHSEWLAEIPAEPWRLVPRLVERVLQALELPDEGARSVTPFRPMPALGSLPFNAAVIPSAVLGYFPADSPAWQNELNDLLTTELTDGPAAIFLGTENSGLAPEPKPARSSSEATQYWTGNPHLTQIGDYARELPLCVVTTPDAHAAVEVVSGLMVDHLGRGERVLLVSEDPAVCAQVESSLQNLGLGSLTARVDDSELTGPNLREHLLQQYAPNPGAGTPPLNDQGANVDRLWQELVHRLSEAARIIHDPRSDGRSFHDLAGEWFELVAVVPPEPGEPEEIPGLTELDAHADGIEALLDSAARLDWPNSPWRDSLAIRPEVLRATSLAEWDRVFSSLMRRAELADKAFEGGELPFSSDVPIAEQVTARQTLAEILQPLVGWDRPHFCVRVAMASPPEVEALARQRETLTAAAEDLIAQPLEPDLWAVILDAVPSLGSVAQSLQILESRLPSGPGGSAANKSAVAQILKPLGLKPTPDNIRRAWVFYRGLSHRLELAQMVNAWLHTGRGRVLDDQRLRRDWEGTGAILAAVEALNRPALRGLREAALGAVREAGPLTDFIDTLRRTTRSAQVLADFEHGVTATGLFAAATYRNWRDAWNRGEPRVAQAAGWHEHVRELPEAAGLLAALANLPPKLSAHVRWHAQRGTAPEIAMLAMRRAACIGELNSRRQQFPILREITGKSLQTSFLELTELSRRRRRQLLQSIRRNWSFRLVNQAPNRTIPDLTNGSILADFRPLWLASPAQALELFSQPGLFAQIIFLGGAQLTLAESLPLMSRANRAVVVDLPQTNRDSQSGNTVDHPGAGWEMHSSGPDLVSAARGANCPEISSTIRHPLAAPESRFNLPTQVPYSRVHPHPHPSRTLAAIGALWRNRCGISNEVHWPTTAGDVDLVLINVAHPASPRVGFIVDLPKPDADPITEWMGRWESLQGNDWLISALWTPELVQRGEDLLATLAADAGISPAPTPPNPDASAEIWTDFSPAPHLSPQTNE